MDRLIDKLVVGIGCAIVVATGESDGYAVVAILCAVVASGLFEWLPRKWRTIAPDAFLVGSLLWPQLLTMVPLMAYDAARWAKDERGGRDESAYPTLPGLVTAVLCLVALIAAALTLPLVSVLLVWLFSGLAVVLSHRTSRTAAREREQRVVQDELRGRGIALETRNRDLRERQDYEVDLATMAERGRIARDIHDNVGHLLTRASLQMEALRVAYGDGDPSLDDRLGSVKGTVDEALASVRQSVHEMHEGTFDLVDRLRTVIGHFEEQSSMTVELTCEFDDVPTNVALAFLAVVKEALTNAARHSGAEVVVVKLTEYPALYQLVVEDDGGQNGASAGDAKDDDAGAIVQREAGVGMGLAAMEERIVALGGHFVSGPRPDGTGWRVFCSVPKTSVSRETFVRPNERRWS